MVTLPLNQRGIDVNLPPDVDAAPPTHQPAHRARDRATNGSRLTAGCCVRRTDERLRTLYEARTDKTLFLMAAGSLRYGDIVEVIDAAKGAGVTRVGIVTDRMRGSELL